MQDTDARARQEQVRLYLASAVECLNIATRTHDIAIRIRLIGMAQSWIELAAQSDRNRRWLPSCPNDEGGRSNHEPCTDPDLTDC
jgi:hypothetical protein